MLISCILTFILNVFESWSPHRIIVVKDFPLYCCASHDKQRITLLQTSFSGHTLPEEDEQKFKSDGGNIIIATPGRIEKCLGQLFLCWNIGSKKYSRSKDPFGYLNTTMIFLKISILTFGAIVISMYSGILFSNSGYINTLNIWSVVHNIIGRQIGCLLT